MCCFFQFFHNNVKLKLVIVLLLISIFLIANLSIPRVQMFVAYPEHKTGNKSFLANSTTKLVVETAYQKAMLVLFK